MCRGDRLLPRASSCYNSSNAHACLRRGASQHHQSESVDVRGGWEREVENAEGRCDQSLASAHGSERDNGGWSGGCASTTGHHHVAIGGRAKGNRGKRRGEVARAKVAADGGENVGVVLGAWRVSTTRHNQIEARGRMSLVCSDNIQCGTNGGHSRTLLWRSHAAADREICGGRLRVPSEKDNFSHN